MSHLHAGKLKLDLKMVEKTLEPEFAFNCLTALCINLKTLDFRQTSG